MRMLYDEKRVVVETYEYNINSGGEFNIEERGAVTIRFVNGIFEKASFPFSGIYTRNAWRILAEIEKKISEIEQKLKGE